MRWPPCHRRRKRDRCREGSLIATGLRVVSVPTTYSRAEWTLSFPIRDESRRVTGGGSGAHLVPRAESGGTAMNALAHCAEALYVAGRNVTGDEHALEGAAHRKLSAACSLRRPRPRARKSLLEGGMHAGIALAMSGIGLAHAMAQAIGAAMEFITARQMPLSAAGASL